MQSTMEKVSSNQVKITLTLEAEAFETALQKAYLKTRGRIAVPGFRKGKAPRKVIERMYGESVFYEDAFDEVFPDLYNAALTEHGIHAVAQPQVDIETIGAGEPLVVNAEVYVMPDITLGEYKGLDVQRPDDTVGDDEIEAELTRMRERNAREAEVEDRPVQDDDIVTLDYAGTVDGVAFDGGTAEGQRLTIGSGQFIPGFEEQMVGMNIGDEKDLHVAFPGEYHTEELAGKEAVFHVKVHAIRTRELPELDDELAKDVSEFDTLDEYKADIRARLKADASARADAEFENALVEVVVENTTMDVPPPMIEREIDSMVQNMAIRLMYQGLKLEDYLSYTGQSNEDLREQYRENAAKRVQGELVLGAIKKAESIEPSEADIDALIAKYAEQQKKEFDEYKQNLSEEQMAFIKQDATTLAVLSLLKEQAKK